jgi:transglutaminase/protease-like cytokinesis protein 3
MIKKVRYINLIRAVVIALIMIFTQVVKSQTTNCYYLIDTFIDSLQIDKNETFEALAKKIIKPEWEECEKARAIFYWIAKNIQYDYEGLKSGYWKNYSSDYKIAFDTYKKRKGVCSGYSYLFALMCKEVGLESIVIDGYSRIESYQAGLPIGEANHTWNVVKIDDKWELIDVTWANSSGIGSNINDYYFLTPPEEFVANHLPEGDEWQLLKNPVDKDEFDVYPYISPDYFKLGFDKDYPKNGILKSNEGVYEINIGVPDNYSLLIKIYDYQNNEWITTDYTTDNKCNNKTIINIKLKGRGYHLVKVSALNQKQSSFTINEGVLYYTLLSE